MIPPVAGPNASHRSKNLIIFLNISVIIIICIIFYSNSFFHMLRKHSRTPKADVHDDLSSMVTEQQLVPPQGSLDPPHQMLEQPDTTKDIQISTSGTILWNHDRECTQENMDNNHKYWVWCSIENILMEDGASIEQLMSHSSNIILQTFNVCLKHLGCFKSVEDLKLQQHSPHMYQDKSEYLYDYMYNIKGIFFYIRSCTSIQGYVNLDHIPLWEKKYDDAIHEALEKNGGRFGPIRTLLDQLVCVGKECSIPDGYHGDPITLLYQKLCHLILIIYHDPRDSDKWMYDDVRSYLSRKLIFERYSNPSNMKLQRNSI